MISIAFINNKGGCGKTTSLFHVAGELASRGKHVLVLDFDKQRDTTMNFLAEEESGYDPKESMTIFDLLTDRNVGFSDCVKQNFIRVGNKKPEYFGIDVIPSDKRLEKQRQLAELVEESRVDEVKRWAAAWGFDYILIDCPPSNRACEKLVLEHIADCVVVPMSTDVNTIRGYGQLLDKVESARDANPELQIIGVFFSMFFKARRKNREYRELMLAKFPAVFIDVQIPNCADVVKAVEDKGQPLAYYKKESVGARQAFSALVDEIENKIQNKGRV